MERISNDSKTTIIAEIGVNHNGDVSLARELINEAHKAGADFAKFQTFRATELTTDRAQPAEYQTKTGARTQRDLLASLELSENDFLGLKQHCELVGIGFLSTAHDFESTNFILNLNLAYIKVPSGDLTNLPFLERVAREKTPVIISTGMASLEEVKDALLALEEAGLRRDMVTVLQCTTNYPAPPEEANLRAMVAMRETLSVVVGYSDHTEGMEAALAAVALGAQVIEKHLTIDKALEGPDHAASASPDEFAQMVRGIRKIEKLLGSTAKEPTQSELPNRPLVRKSLVAGTKIKSGEEFSPTNIAIKRPGTGMSPMRWHSVIGQIAHRDFELDEEIELA